jgi:hypothetical protein
MIVIAHQAVSQHLGLVAFHRICDDRLMPWAIFVITINDLAPISTRGDAVSRTREFNAERTRHGPMLARVGAKGKT